ncbi:MAG TPA: LysM peptidoglycan-binding domain-containing protein [Ignavibacteria bacterium]|nr:LysM peptidoglycan-binding domain-containing protein [Ignavibacteria bacterium]
MKIDLKDNPDDINYIIRDFPVNYKYSGENESFDTLKIFIKHDTLKEIDEYLSGDLQNELGGVVLGDVCANSSGHKFIFIDNLIIAKHSNSSLSRLTFTHETWDYINHIQEKDYPERKILGWFHSHPGHTVFLSNYDMFIHENFFNMEYMVAYVFDPTIKERGFFYWKEGKIIKADGYFVTDPVENDIDDDFTNDLLPQSQNDEIELKTAKSPVFPGTGSNTKKTEIRGAVLIGLLFLALLVLLFMIYNIYEIRQKALLKDEYSKDLAEIRNENRILSERLNNLIEESEMKKGNITGTKSNLKEISESVKVENEKKESTNEKKPDLTDVKNEENVKKTEKPEENNSSQQNNNTEDVTVYKVKNGDTLEKISNQFYKSRDGIEIIMKKNNLKDKASIKIGQQLLIPVSLQ